MAAILFVCALNGPMTMLSHNWRETAGHSQPRTVASIPLLLIAVHGASTRFARAPVSDDEAPGDLLLAIGASN
jgi:hypothetical protein